MSSLLRSGFGPLRNIKPSMPYKEYMTFCGLEFELTWIESAVAAGATVYLRNITCAEKYTIFVNRQITMDQERGFYRAYTDWNHDETEIEELPYFKLRADSSIECGGNSYRVSGPTGIVEASKTIDLPLFGSSSGLGPFSSTSGDLQEDTAIRIIPPNTQFLVEFENASESTAYFQTVFKFFELSEENMIKLYEL